MVSNLEDTIVALASPPGRGALGIIRISGQNAFTIVNQFYPAKDFNQLASHTVHYGWFKTLDGEPLDETVFTIFKAPRSFTRQNIIEISAHGNPLILNQIIEQIVQAGARVAEPGEFTLRAFLNGSIDLTQAEAIADMIAASSEPSRRLAMNHLRGGYAQRLQNLRKDLVHLASLVELELDFVEEDVEFADRGTLVQTLHHLQDEINLLIASFKVGNAYRNGILTAIVGKPNAGKSTLLNTLLNESKAIVSNIPGTTRDVIEEKWFLGGYEFLLMDTAGIRQSEDLIEQEGVKRTLDKIATASIIIYLFDPNHENPEDARQAIQEMQTTATTQILLVANKMDTLESHFVDRLNEMEIITISAQNPKAVQALTEALITVAESYMQYDVVISNQRHLWAMQKVNQALQASVDCLNSGTSNDLLAAELRFALQYIGEITGEITNDEILGNIFSKFCIGK